jgi:hypothetical protein
VRLAGGPVFTAMVSLRGCWTLTTDALGARWLGNMLRRVEKLRTRCTSQIADISMTRSSHSVSVDRGSVRI